MARLVVLGVAARLAGSPLLPFMRLKSSQTAFLSDQMCAPCMLWPVGAKSKANSHIMAFKTESLAFNPGRLPRWLVAIETLR